MRWADTWGEPWESVQGSTEAQTLRLRAEAQADAAQRGQGLRTTQTERHPQGAWSAPTSVWAAYHRAAYWLAVGARVLVARGQRNEAARLLSASAQYSRQGRVSSTTRAFIFTGSTEAAAQIQQQAAQLASAAGLPDIAVILTQGSSYEAQQAARSYEYQRSARGVVTGTVKGTARDAIKAGETGAKIAQRGGQYITGERPQGTTEIGWWIERNAVRLGVGLVAVSVAAWVLRPYLQAARAAASRRG